MKIDYASEIKHRVPVAVAAKQYGLAVNRDGFCCCPFHGEKTPSMKLYPGAGGYYCFGCGETGSVIDLTMKLYGLDFKRALSKLNNDFALCLPLNSKPTAEQRREARRLQAERKSREQHVAALRRRYDFVLHNFIRLDRNYDKYRPKSPDESLDPRFVEAAHKRDYAWELLLETELEVRHCE